MMYRLGFTFERHEDSSGWRLYSRHRWFYLSWRGPCYVFYLSLGRVEFTIDNGTEKGW